MLTATLGVLENATQSMERMRSGYESHINQLTTTHQGTTALLDRAIFDNSRTAESLNSQYQFLRGATLTLIDNRSGGSSRFQSGCFNPDGNVAHELQTFRQPQPLPLFSPFQSASSVRRELEVAQLPSSAPTGHPAGVSATSPFGTPRPESPFQPMGTAAVAAAVSSPPATLAANSAALSHLKSMDAESLGRLFAAQNPEVLQQILQIVARNKP
jgi:hypothetical protein